MECSDGTVRRLRSFLSRSRDSLISSFYRMACLRNCSSLSISLCKRAVSELNLASFPLSCILAVSSAYFYNFSNLICSFSLSSCSLLFFNRADSLLHIFYLLAISCFSFSFSPFKFSICIFNSFIYLFNLSSSDACYSFPVFISSFNFLLAYFYLII